MNLETRATEKVHFQSSEFKKIEAIAKVKFNIQQRKEIRRALLEFVEGRLTWNEMPRDEAGRDDLEKVIKRLEDLLNALKVSAWTEHLFWESGLKRKKVEAILKLLRSRYVGWRSFFSGRGRPFDHCLSYLLDELESIFKEAGGGATGVSRNDSDKRESRFVDFVAAVIAVLSEATQKELYANPGEVKRLKSPALMAFWERMRKWRRSLPK